MSHHDEFEPMGGKILTRPFVAAAVIFILGSFLILKRFFVGLGPVSGMNDGFALGIWIAYDVVVGTAIGCGGYAVALLVYALNRGQYHPLVRSALLTGAFGYTLAGTSVVIDLGRYWNMYNLFLPWRMNFNSALFEIAMCVMAYTMVLWIEFSPAILEKFKPGWVRFVNRWMFVFIALGMLLPTMHQSSLGSLMIIAGHKLSPLWQTTWLPAFFLITCIAMGYAMVVFESLWSSVGFRRPLETPMLARLAGIIPWLLGIYLVGRFVELASRGALGHALQFDLCGIMFWIENILYIIPIVVLASAKRRSDPRTLFLSALSALFAGSIYRFNVYLVGLYPGFGWRYFPSTSELLITFGIISIEIMGYLFIVKKLSVLPKVEHA
jgi:Ni/Fe-hydrogenase subunit HybB-like protein